jgi:hypothetical protein
MANWRDSVLKKFKRGIARLTLVSDPDGLLTEEGTLAAIKERGFDLISFEDSISFRYTYESKYRSLWDQGHKTDLVVVLQSQDDLPSLPYDLLHVIDSRKLEFSLFKLFPNLNYPVLKSLDSGCLDPLFEAYQQQAGSVLGENGTKEFVLTHCFQIVPSLIMNTVGLMEMLLRRHYQNAPIPLGLNEYLLHWLRSRRQFAAWPLDDILANRSEFISFLQEQWPVYIKSLKGDGEKCLVPFDHRNVRAFVDTFFLEGLLKPIQVEDAKSLPTWVQVGLLHDPDADALARLQKLLHRCKEKIPNDDAVHREWQSLARTWAELVVLRWELDSRLDAPDRLAYDELHQHIENQFSAWMLNRFGSLHNLPHATEPVMVHHVPRYLATMRSKYQLTKVALVVVDGLALDQWLLLRSLVESKQMLWKLTESSVFAWVPTLTSVSRQSIFAGAVPHLFSESLHTTDREPSRWTRFWEDEGVVAGSVEYAKMVETGESEQLEVCLHNPHVAVLGVVVNWVDKIADTENQGTAGVHDAIRLWSDKFISLFDRLLDEGFSVFVTADHGNVAADGMGSPQDGVLVEIGGKRARIYDNPNFRDEAKKEFPESIEWPCIGLPSNWQVLLPKGLRAYTQEGKHVVAHGGISLEEVIVPFVQITRAGK